MPLKGKLIHPTEDPKEFELPDGREGSKEINRLLDEAVGQEHCCIEFVHLAHRGVAMIVDGEGLLKELPQNLIASELYGGHIAGPALVFDHAEFMQWDETLE